MTTTAQPAEDADAVLPTRKAEPVLRADRRGYVLGEQSIDGFEDRSGLTDAGRLNLARWAHRFTPDQLSTKQEELLARAGAQPREIDEELLSAALIDAEEHLERAYAVGFYSELSSAQLELVRDPSRHPALKGRGYPLSMGDMEALTGASGRQLRYWHRLGLLPAHRIGNRRQFLSAAVVRAFALKEAQQHEVAAFAALSRGGPEAARFVRLFGAVLGSAANSVRGRGGRELRSAAEVMVRHAQEFVSHARAESDTAARTEAPHARRSERGATGNDAARYDVRPKDEGGWAVAASNAKRASSRHRTKQAAVSAARTFAANRGGGEVVVHQRDGGKQRQQVSPAGSNGSSAKSDGKRATGRKSPQRSIRAGTRRTKRVARSGSRRS